MSAPAWMGDGELVSPKDNELEPAVTVMFVGLELLTDWYVPDWRSGWLKFVSLGGAKS